MREEELQTLLLQTAEVLEQFRRLSHQASQSQVQSAEQLQRIAQSAPAILREAADDSLSNLSHRVKSEVTGGLNQAAEELQKKLVSAGNQMTSAGQSSQATADQLKQVLNRLLFAVTGCAVLMLVAIGGGVWLSKHYYQQITENQISAKLLKAYNTADVIVCGERLCANVDDKAPRTGDRGKYLPVKDR